MRTRLWPAILLSGFVALLAACETLEPLPDDPAQPGEFPEQEPSDPFDPNQEDDPMQDPFDPNQDDGMDF